MKKAEIIHKYLLKVEKVWTPLREKELDRKHPYSWFENELRKLRQTTENES